jgi:hypothetical protein
MPFSLIEGGIPAKILYLAMSASDPTEVLRSWQPEIIVPVRIFFQATVLIGDGKLRNV